MATTPEGYMTHEQQVGKAEAISGFVLGIASILLALVPLIGLACGIVGVVLSSKGRHKYVSAHFNLAKAGLVLSIIGIVLGSFATLAWLAAMVGVSMGWFSETMGY